MSPALAYEGKRSVQILPDVGEDSPDRAVVELLLLGGGGREADEGAEHLREAISLLADLAALCFEGFGFVDGDAEALRRDEGGRELVSDSALFFHFKK